MTQNEFSSIVFTQELEEKLFLIHRTFRLERAPRFTVSWFMVGLVYSGPPGGSSTEGRGGFFQTQKLLPVPSLHHSSQWGVI